MGISYVAMLITDEVLEKYPQLLANFGLTRGQVLGQYMVRKLEPLFTSYGIFTLDDFNDLFTWTHNPITVDWTEVIPSGEMYKNYIKSAIESSDPNITILKVTHMSDHHTEMLFEVSDDCPESVRFLGVSLIAMVRLLKSFKNAEYNSVQQEYSWKWELVPYNGSEGRGVV